MAAAQGLYAETTADVTNSTHPTYTDCAAIASGSFTANKEYLIIAGALFECASSTAEHHIQLQHGTTDFDDADAVIDPGSGANGGFCCGWMHRLSQGASPEAVTIRAAGEAAVITVLGSQIFALKLSDDFTENTDFYWNEVTADYTTTATPTAQASVTFTPNGTDTWLVIGQFAQGLPVGLTNPFNAELHDSVAGAGPAIVIESEDSDAGDENRCMLLAWVVTPTAASHTFSTRFSHGGSTAFTVFSSRILALKLDKFNQFFGATTAGATTPSTSPSWSTIATGSVTPSVTGDWFYLGSHSFDVGTAAAEQNIRLQHDDSGSLASDPAYGDNGVNAPAFDATDDIPMHLFKLRSLTSGALRTVNYDATNISGTGTAKQRTIAGFSLELAGGAPATQAPYMTLRTRWWGP